MPRLTQRLIRLGFQLSVVQQIAHQQGAYQTTNDAANDPADDSTGSRAFFRYDVHFLRRPKVSHVMLLIYSRGVAFIHASGILPQDPPAFAIIQRPGACC
jgi:hypothetical protein